MIFFTSVICCYFQIIDNNSFWKINCFTFFPYKSIRDQIWPCRKIGQGQPRVIVWTNLVVLEHPMLHTKFQGHRPFDSGEADVLRFLPYMGMAAILVMWHGPFEQIFVPHPMEALYEIWVWLAQRFLRRRCLKSGRLTDRPTDDARRKPTYPISSPVSLRIRWAKNRLFAVTSYLAEILISA